MKGYKYIIISVLCCWFVFYGAFAELEGISPQTAEKLIKRIEGSRGIDRGTYTVEMEQSNENQQQGQSGGSTQGGSVANNNPGNSASSEKVVQVKVFGIKVNEQNAAEIKKQLLSEEVINQIKQEGTATITVNKEKVEFSRVHVIDILEHESFLEGASLSVQLEPEEHTQLRDIYHGDGNFMSYVSEFEDPNDRKRLLAQIQEQDRAGNYKYPHARLRLLEDVMLQDDILGSNGQPLSDEEQKKLYAEAYGALGVATSDFFLSPDSIIVALGGTIAPQDLVIEEYADTMQQVARASFIPEEKLSTFSADELEQKRRDTNKYLQDKAGKVKTLLTGEISESQLATLERRILDKQYVDTSAGSFAGIAQFFLISDGLARSGYQGACLVFGCENTFSMYHGNPSLERIFGMPLAESICFHEAKGYLNTQTEGEVVKTIDSPLGDLEGVTSLSGGEVVKDLRAQMSPILPDNTTQVTYSYIFKNNINPEGVKVGIFFAYGDASGKKVKMIEKLQTVKFDKKISGFDNMQLQNVSRASGGHTVVMAIFEPDATEQNMKDKKIFAIPAPAVVMNYEKVAGGTVITSPADIKKVEQPKTTRLANNDLDKLFG